MWGRAGGRFVGRTYLETDVLWGGGFVVKDFLEVGRWKLEGPFGEGRFVGCDGTFCTSTI